MKDIYSMAPALQLEYRNQYESLKDMFSICVSGISFQIACETNWVMLKAS